MQDLKYAFFLDTPSGGKIQVKILNLTIRHPAAKSLPRVDMGEEVRGVLESNFPMVNPKDIAAIATYTVPVPMGDDVHEGPDTIDGFVVMIP